jgi:hypothetical protein
MSLSALQTTISSTTRWSLSDAFPSLFYPYKDPNCESNTGCVNDPNPDAVVVKMSETDKTMYALVHPNLTEHLDSMRRDSEYFITQKIDVQISYLLFWCAFTEFMHANKITHCGVEMTFSLGDDCVTDSYFAHLVDCMVSCVRQFILVETKKIEDVRPAIQCAAWLMFIMRYIDEKATELPASEFQGRLFHLQEAMCVLARCKVREACVMYVTEPKKVQRAMCYWDLYKRQPLANLARLNSSTANELRMHIAGADSDHELNKRMSKISCLWLLQQGYTKAAYQAVADLSEVRAEVTAVMDESATQRFMQYEKLVHADDNDDDEQKARAIDCTSGTEPQHEDKIVVVRFQDSPLSVNSTESARLLNFQLFCKVVT